MATKQKVDDSKSSLFKKIKKSGRNPIEFLCDLIELLIEKDSEPKPKKQ